MAADFQDDTNSPLIITIGAMSGFLVIVAVIGLQAWFMREEQEELNEKYAGSVNYQLTALRHDQQANISSYRWIDREKQIAAVPVDEAMKLLIQNNGKLPK
jgi:hypothetical protein